MQMTRALGRARRHGRGRRTTDCLSRERVLPARLWLTGKGAGRRARSNRRPRPTAPLAHAMLSRIGERFRPRITVLPKHDLRKELQSPPGSRRAVRACDHTRVSGVGTHPTTGPPRGAAARVATAHGRRRITETTRDGSTNCTLVGSSGHHGVGSCGRRPAR